MLDKLGAGATSTQMAEGLAKLKHFIDTQPQRKRSRVEIAMESPYWDRELHFEELMLATGAEIVERHENRAKERKTRSRLKPYQKLTEGLIIGVSEAIRQYMQTQENAPRAKSIAYRPMLGVPQDTLALIGLRCLLDNFDPEAGHGVMVLSLAYRIGGMVEQEARMRLWEKKKPDIWYKVQRRLLEDKATSQHRVKTNINRFNKLVRDDLGWRDWDSNVKKHVGLDIISCMVAGSGPDKDHRAIYLEKDPQHERTGGKADAAPWVVSLDDDTCEWLLQALDDDRLINPVYMPMIMPPAPWSKMWDGGYVCGILPQRTLIRFRADNAEVAHTALDELGKVKMPNVYKAINRVQEVPWAINERMLDIMHQAWDRDLGIGGIFKREAEAVPHKEKLKDPNFGTTEERRVWRREAARVIKRNRLKASGIDRQKRILWIAEQYRHEDRIYFPHAFDFRGRMYPMPVGLQPQGDDIARGLLTFAEELAKPLGVAGAYWLAIHLANVWGHDKVSFDDRIAWVEKNTDMFVKIASDPLKYRRWAGKGTEPWQALAATLEWVRYLEQGPDMMCALPVRLDGTCNGIQHLSAMVRDEDSGAAVNLVPNDRPRDIYREVGVNLETILLGLIEDGSKEDRKLASRWLELVNGTIPRIVTKRPVMILPYGGTKRAYQKYTDKWFTEEFDPDEKLVDWAERRELVNWLVGHLWDAVEAKLPRAREVQRWLQSCARLAARAKPPAGVVSEGVGLPLRWQTPDGFVVRHFYGAHSGRMINTMIDGQLVKLWDVTITKDLDLEGQLRGIPPNFVHSMDGCMNRMAINMAYRLGIDALTCIHDAFGTVPADVDLLNACLRSSFVDMYRKPVLANFREHCLRLLVGDLHTAMRLEPVPRMGKLDLERVLDAKYMFA